MIATSRCTVIVTAAGASRRMLSPKPLLEWEGKLLLQHQLEELAGWGDVIVVLGAEADRVRAAVAFPAYARIVVAENWEAGRSASLAAGFAAVTGTPEGLMVVGVDQPLDRATLKALAHGLKPGVSFVRPVCKGVQAHPILFDGSLLDTLRGVEGEAEGLKSIVRRLAPTSVEVSVSGPLHHFNTLAEYAEARAPFLDALVERLPAFPIHSTRRSLPLFIQRLRENFNQRPDLIYASKDVFLGAFVQAANHSCWVHVAASSHEAMDREVPAAWARIRANLRSPHGYKAEAWLASSAQGRAYEGLGFSLSRRMLRYRLETIGQYKPVPGVRPYEERDFSDIIRIHRAGSNPTEQISEASYLELLTILDRTVVLEAEGRVVGYTHLQMVQDMGLFQGLVVDPEAQGKGYGRALVQDAMGWFAERGAKAVELLTLIEAVPAQRLYESFGFVSCGEQLWMEAQIAPVPDAVDPVLEAELA